MQIKLFYANLTAWVHEQDMLRCMVLMDGRVVGAPYLGLDVQDSNPSGNII